MCSHYKAPPTPEIYRINFGVEPPVTQGKHDVWPGYAAGFICRHENADVGDAAVPPRVALTGLFGMIPRWAKDTKYRYPTYNARSETAAQKPSFRDAWRKGQHCIIPAVGFFEPDWRSGRAVPTLIERADGRPMGIAGLWENWTSPEGEIVYSFTMLTINASEHPLMNAFHKPEDEKRMVVILPEDRYGDWLEAKPERSMEFMCPFPAELMSARPTVTHQQLF